MNKPLKWLALPLAIALLGAGCNPFTPETRTPGSPSGKTASGGSRCANLYYPLEAGSKITYTMRSGGQDIPFTIAVIEHDADSIKLEYTFVVEGREAKITNDMVCEGGTIRGKGHFDFASAFTGLDISYDVLEMSGAIMPADIHVGSEWTMTSRVKANVSDATSPIGQMMNGQITSTTVENKVVGEERVTVPAGTFTALKIEQKVSTNLTVAGRPISTSMTNYAWYAKDVGLIKSQSTSAGSDFTMEAQTISP